MSLVRPAVLAGSWYPGDAVMLARAVDGYLAAARGAADLPPAPAHDGG